MTDDDTEETLPTHRAYTLIYKDMEREQADGLELGVVWVHRDGNGFDVVLKGRLTLRAINAKS